MPTVLTPFAHMSDDDLRREGGELRRQISEVTDAALDANRNLTAEEARRLKSLRRRRNDLQDEIDRRAAGEPLDQGETEERRAMARRMAGSTALSVGAEPMTYGPGSRYSYFADLTRRKMDQAPDASERLARHRGEVEIHRARGDIPGLEQRDLTRVDGAGGEFVPPLWLMSEFVEVARAGRVTADLCTGHDLPAGTDSLNIPRVATGATVAMQTADNAAVSETDAVTDSIAAPVRTVAGQQDVALQLLEQSVPGIDQVIFADLAAAHAEAADAQVINGSAAAGQVRGILQITAVDTTAYTDATPTLPELYPKVADSLNEVLSGRHMPPDAIVMHPRRWTWILAQLDSSNRPFVVPSAGGPQNSPVTIDGNGSNAGRVGSMLGTAVYVDANVPTNLGAGTDEDVIIVGRFTDALLWESIVKTRVLPEVGSGTLTVRLQLYNYLAFTAERYLAAWSIISGSGLVTPVFA